jgi:hypothetical protein
VAQRLHTVQSKSLHPLLSCDHHSSLECSQPLPSPQHLRRLPRPAEPHGNHLHHSDQRLNIDQSLLLCKKHEYLEATHGNLGERRVPAQELPTRESNPARFDLLEESEQRTFGHRGILFDRLVFHSSSERQEAIAVRKLVPFRYRNFAEIRVDVFAPSGEYLVLRHDQSQSGHFDFCVDDVRWGSMRHLVRQPQESQT